VRKKAGCIAGVGIAGSRLASWPQESLSFQNPGICSKMGQRRQEVRHRGYRAMQFASWHADLTYNFDRPVIGDRQRIAG
jgi:hypothetical protein